MCKDRDRTAKQVRRGQILQHFKNSYKYRKTILFDISILLMYFSPWSINNGLQILYTYKIFMEKHLTVSKI